MTLLRRHGLWLIIAALVGIAGAWLYYSAAPHVYLSTAQVDVEPSAALGTAVTPNMATEQQVATSGLVLGRTATALGVSVPSLSGDLSASTTSTATVLSIGCSRPNAGAAQRCAQAAADAYIGYRNELSSTKAQQAKDPLHVTLVTPATLPVKPAGPGKKILLPIGGVLGLALGLGAVVVRDRFDNRVRDRADLERCLGGPVLAAIPRLGRAVDPASVFSRAPSSTAAEAYRYLRAHVRPLSGRGGGTVLLVTGPQGFEGRTCVTANLARALAQAGACVIAVDADLRHTWASRPLRARKSLTEVFDSGDRAGLSELLAGAASVDEVALPAETPAGTRVAPAAGTRVAPAAGTRVAPAAGLRFVAAGVAAGEAADLLDTARLTAALAGLRAAADVVVVDSPPVLTVSDAMSLARASDMVLMVADVRRTGRAEVSAAGREIRAARPPLLAGVLNNEPFSHRWPRTGPEREREWLAPWDAGPPGSAGPLLPNGQNGQRPAQLGAASPRSYRPSDSGEDGPTAPFG